MVIPMPQKENVIDVSALKQGGRTLSQNLIAPAREEVQSEALQNHAADPIKSVDTIFQISRFLISQQRYRDNMLFIVGINFGLRVSDLRTLRFSDLINEHCTFRDRFPVFERKTRNTRKRKKNRYADPYIRSLGIARVRQLVAEQEADFAKAKVIHGCYTDSEDCSYNSVVWADEDQEPSLIPGSFEGEVFHG